MPAPVASNRLTARHFPDRIPSTDKKKRPTRVCKVCSEKSKAATGKSERQETGWWCPDCSIPLCLPECFKLYHTKGNYIN